MTEPLPLDGLLLEAPLPLWASPEGLRIESQAANGLRLWAKNFGRVTMCAPTIHDPAQGDSQWQWVDPMKSIEEGQLTLVPLPMAYRADHHMRARASVSRVLAELIDSHRYLMFCNLGGAGAWGSLGARIARTKGRAYATGLDWVLHEMPLPVTRNPLRCVKNRIERMWLRRSSLESVRHAQLFLAHGATVLRGYAPYARHAELIHDIHLGPGALIGPADLSAKLAREQKLIRIAYVGRVHPMKGPHDWIEVIRRLLPSVPSGLKVEASWYGDGPLIDECRARVAAMDLAGVVRFVGVERDRDALLHHLRQADLFLFCHLTPESPRCLIEALMSGTPLVGYVSEYAEELTSGVDAAVLTPLGDVAQLSNALQSLLAGSRERLRRLTTAAAACGRQFTDEAVFNHRSMLIRRYLP